MTQQDYDSAYSDGAFWGKVTSFAKKAGRAVIESALQLYYALQDADTPLWAKTTIIGALGYFISPVDLIPDLLPMIGYSDDLVVLGGALTAVCAHIKAEHRARAFETVQRWFG